MSFHELSILPGQTVPTPRTGPVAGLHVLVALSSGHDIFSLSILLDLLAAANRIARFARFSWQVAEGDRAAGAMQRLLHEYPAAQCLMLIADADGDFAADLPATLAAVWHKGGLVGGWGKGCLAIAAAGLLDRRRFALTAADRADLWLRWPELIPTDQFFCEDDRVLTSVGKSIFSDMVLHLIRQHCGRQVMVAVMEHCLIRRAPGDGHPTLGQPPAEPARMDPGLSRSTAGSTKTSPAASRPAILRPWWVCQSVSWNACSCGICAAHPPAIWNTSACVVR